MIFLILDGFGVHSYTSEHWKRQVHYFCSCLKQQLRQQYLGSTNLSPLILLEYYCTAALHTVGSGACVGVGSEESHCVKENILNCSYYRVLHDCPW